MVASLGCNHLAAVSSVLFMLDRTPDDRLWDPHFSERWTRFRVDELNAIGEWLEALFLVDPSVLDDMGQIRALVTLDLLKSKAVTGVGGG